jgi:hypothetical protein
MSHIPNPTGKGGFKDNPQNINTDGRPKGISITEMVKEALETVESKTGKKWKDLIIKRILLKAVNEGDTQMLKAIWSYIDGAPPQSVDVTSDGERIKSIYDVFRKYSKDSAEAMETESD